MSLDGSSPLLADFKAKIEEAVSYVPKMIAEEKLKAVQFWNLVSEKLQEIVNSSAADINALALKMEKENAEKMSLLLTPPDENEPAKDFILSDREIMGQGRDTNSFNANATLQQPTSNGCLPFLNQNGINPMVQNPSNLLNNSSSSFTSSLGCGISLSEPLGVMSGPSVPIPDFQSQDISNSVMLTTPQLPLPNESDICSEQMIEETKDSINQSYSRRVQQKKLARTKITPKNEKELRVSDISTKEPEDLIMQTTEEKLDGSDEENKIPKPEGDEDIENSGNEFKDFAFGCESCSKSFETEVELKDHELTTHTRRFPCDECGQRFTTKANLNVHKRRHTGERPFQCPICQQSFSTQGNQKRHIKSHTGEKPFGCTQCGQCFTEKKSLTVHIRRHTGERPYECKECDRKFSQLAILQTHMAVHLNLKVYLCQHCGKSFRQKTQLTVHLLRHDGVKKFFCETCPAQFLTKGDLERHNRIHTGERPFTCNICKKSYTRQQCLNEHMNRHYGIKPYACKYCHRRFSEMSACYKHTKNHEKSGRLKVGGHIESLNPDDPSDLIGFLVGNENEIQLPKVAEEILPTSSSINNEGSDQSSSSVIDINDMGANMNIKIVNVVGNVNENGDSTTA